jgi:CRP/FNR family transcriptional regulator
MAGRCSAVLLELPGAVTGTLLPVSPQLVLSCEATRRLDARLFHGVDRLNKPSYPAVLEEAALIAVPAGAHVFHQGDAAEHYLLVTTGSVKVFARSDEGREVVLYRVAPGEMCTLTTACLLGDTRYPAEAVAETDSQARAVSADRFAELVNESAEFRAFVFNSFSARIASLMHRLETLVLSSVERKLADYLLEHANGDGMVKSTHENIALEIGTAREVVSRHLKALEARGCVTLQRGCINIQDASSLRSRR